MANGNVPAPAPRRNPSVPDHWPSEDSVECRYYRMRMLFGGLDHAREQLEEVTGLLRGTPIDLYCPDIALAKSAQYYCETKIQLGKLASNLAALVDHVNAEFMDVDNEVDVVFGRLGGER